MEIKDYVKQFRDLQKSQTRRHLLAMTSKRPNLGPGLIWLR